PTLDPTEGAGGRASTAGPDLAPGSSPRYFSSPGGFRKKRNHTLPATISRKKRNRPIVIATWESFGGSTAGFCAAAAADVSDAADVAGAAAAGEVADAAEAAGAGAVEGAGGAFWIPETGFVSFSGGGSASPDAGGVGRARNDSGGTGGGGGFN